MQMKTGHKLGQQLDLNVTVVVVIAFLSLSLSLLYSTDMDLTWLSESLVTFTNVRKSVQVLAGIKYKITTNALSTQCQENIRVILTPLRKVT